MGIKASHSQCFFFFIGILLCSGTLLKGSEDRDHRPTEEKDRVPVHRELIENDPESNGRMTQLDGVTPTTTVPIFNPTSPTTTTPIINPVSSTPFPPMTPVTNPDTTPMTGSPTPNLTPTTGGTPGMSSGQSWCIASQAASDTALQVALDYACGYGGADCSAIQTGGSCFNPDTVRDHASYAFNDYYQKNPVPTSCDFGGTAILTNTDPSSQNCQYPGASTSSGVPNTNNPYGSTPNPYGTPPNPYGSTTNPYVSPPVFGSVPIAPDTSYAAAKLMKITQSTVASVLLVLACHSTRHL